MPTITAPPAMLPSVTGKRLHAKNFTINVTRLMFPAGMPLIKEERIPTGIKYMFATQCSNPHRTNRNIGRYMAASYS